MVRTPAECHRFARPLAVHFEIAYNGDRIIEINVSTDPSQVVDISEDVVKVISGAPGRLPLHMNSAGLPHTQCTHAVALDLPVAECTPAGQDWSLLQCSSARVAVS